MGLGHTVFGLTRLFLIIGVIGQIQETQMIKCVIFSQFIGSDSTIHNSNLVTMYAFKKKLDILSIYQNL